MQVFNALDQAKTFLSDRQRAYQNVFGDSVMVNEVMRDLEKFCRDRRPSNASTSEELWMIEGRREVYNRIKQHLELSHDQLWELFSNSKNQ